MAKREGELIGNYRLVRRLEDRELDTIYLGEDIQNHHQVSITIFFSSSSYLRNEFFENARKLVQLKHPNILQLQDFGEDRNDYFLVLNNVQLSSLRSLHPKKSILPLVTVVSYIRQLSAAMQFAHASRIINRSIQPANMFVGPNNDILLGGFESLLLDLNDDDKMRLSIVEERWNYLAPEFHRNIFIPASNQYELAAVAYEWLYGDVPFHGDWIQIAYQHVHTFPPSLREKNSFIPQAVEDVIMKALSKKPEDRYESITIFAEAFERAATSKSIRTKPLLRKLVANGVLFNKAGGIGELFGLYRTTRLLGQGNMGKVYFAEDSIQQSDGTWRKQSVAVKVLHNWYDEDIFRNHALKMTKLQHANILSTLLFGMKDDAPYIVMQYASQGTLLARHPRGTILPVESILSYVKQIASALQYAHERDMIGDVRPKKMFVGTNNTILVRSHPQITS